MQNLLEKQEYAPHFSGHETFPLRQTWLKKAFEQRLSDGTVPKVVFSSDESIGTFGVGKNMVSSIKHWALACGLLEETLDKSAFRIADTWKLILAENGRDPYCENSATAWFAHWRLAGSPPPQGKHRSTTWWFIFNCVTSPIFSRDDIVDRISEYAAQQSAKVSEATLRRDVETCLRGYCPKADGGVEDVAEPLLAELGLLLDEGKGRFAFRRGPKRSLPNGLFDFALLEYWEANHSEANSLSFEAIAYGPGSPGRVFKLDEDSVAEKLFGLEERTRRALAWSDSSGVRQIVREPLNSKSKSHLLNRLLKAAYE